MVDVGFVHGRFQIFHKDHLAYVLAAKEQCRKLIVGITSPDIVSAVYEPVDPHRSAVLANPCTYYERMCMIKGTLQMEGFLWNDFDIVPLPIGKPELIKNYVPDDAVSFFTIYDAWGYEKLRRIRDLGYQTVVLWDNKKKGISGTEIRKAIATGVSWKQYVPDFVYDYMIDSGIDKRIKQAGLTK